MAKALERLADSGTIRRLARGLYDYPEKHPVLGELPANYERIAQVLAGRDSFENSTFRGICRQSPWLNRAGTSENCFSDRWRQQDSAGQKSADCFKKNNTQEYGNCWAR